jgi:Ca2+-binding EF-hand superfamily protein
MKSSCRGKMHKPSFNSVPRRSVVFKRWTMLLVMLAVTTLFAMVGTTIAAQKEAAPKAQDNVTVGEPEVKKMLPLMDQDNDGKVSKQDFMSFMEAEFDRLDNKKEGKLDVKKLTQPPAQPVRGFHK